MHANRWDGMIRIGMSDMLMGFLKKKTSSGNLQVSSSDEQGTYLRQGWDWHAKKNKKVGDDSNAPALLECEINQKVWKKQKVFCFKTLSPQQLHKHASLKSRPVYSYYSTEVPIPGEWNSATSVSVVVIYSTITSLWPFLWRKWLEKVILQAKTAAPIDTLAWNIKWKTLFTTLSHSTVSYFLVIAWREN